MRACREREKNECVTQKKYRVYTCVRVHVCVFPEAQRRREVQPSYYKTTNYDSQTARNLLLHLLHEGKQGSFIRDSYSLRLTKRKPESPADFFVSIRASYKRLSIISRCASAGSSGGLLSLFTLAPPLRCDKSADSNILLHKRHSAKMKEGRKESGMDFGVAR